MGIVMHVSAKTKATRCACLLMLAVVFGSCVTPATEVIVRVDTNIPFDLPVVMHVRVENAAMPVPDADWSHSWVRGALEGGVTFPASFAIVPPPEAARDAHVVVHIVADARDFQLRRELRFQFIPHETRFVPVFLSAACAAPATGCHSTGVPCTTQQLCEESGLTCGNSGTCVPVEVAPVSENGPAFAGSLSQLGPPGRTNGTRRIVDDGLYTAPRLCVGSRCVTGTLAP